MGMHNRSENGHGAWVTLCAHPIHTDIDNRQRLQNVTGKIMQQSDKCFYFQPTFYTFFWLDG
jgi:hypothetical protein